jgi:hypothetical protein
VSELDLSENPLGDAGVLRLLARGLSGALATLSLKAVGLGPSALQRLAVLVQADGNGLRTLRIANNR